MIQTDILRYFQLTYGFVTCLLRYSKIIVDFFSFLLLIGVWESMYGPWI